MVKDEQFKIILDLINKSGNCRATQFLQMIAGFGSIRTDLLNKILDSFDCIKDGLDIIENPLFAKFVDFDEFMQNLLECAIDEVDPVSCIRAELQECITSITPLAYFEHLYKIS